MQAIASFTLAPDEAAAHITALEQLNAGKQGAIRWRKATLRACEDALARHLQLLSAGQISGAGCQETTAAVAALFIVGEVRVFKD